MRRHGCGLSGKTERPRSCPRRRAGRYRSTSCAIGPRSWRGTASDVCRRTVGDLRRRTSGAAVCSLTSLKNRLSLDFLLAFGICNMDTLTNNAMTIPEGWSTCYDISSRVHSGALHERDGRVHDLVDEVRARAAGVARMHACSLLFPPFPQNGVLITAGRDDARRRLLCPNSTRTLQKTRVLAASGRYASCHRSRARRAPAIAGKSRAPTRPAAARRIAGRNEERVL